MSKSQKILNLFAQIVLLHPIFWGCLSGIIGGIYLHFTTPPEDFLGLIGLVILWLVVSLILLIFRDEFVPAMDYFSDWMTNHKDFKQWLFINVQDNKVVEHGHFLFGKLQNIFRVILTPHENNWEWKSLPGDLEEKLRMFKIKASSCHELAPALVNIPITLFFSKGELNLQGLINHVTPEGKIYDYPSYLRKRLQTAINAAEMKIRTFLESEMTTNFKLEFSDPKESLKFKQAILSLVMENFEAWTSNDAITLIIEVASPKVYTNLDASKLYRTTPDPATTFEQPLSTAVT